MVEITHTQYIRLRSMIISLKLIVLQSSVAKMGKDTETKTNLLLQVALRETVVAYFELRSVDICEIRIDAKGIQLGNVMATNLINAHE